MDSNLCSEKITVQQESSLAMTLPDRKTFSIVVPVYFNELNLPDTIPQLMALSPRLPDFDLELVFVDDGSKDGSLEILLDFQQLYPRTVRVVKLTRNFGAMAAIQAGLIASSGDCVGVIAADLQDPPELFLEMIQHWRNGTKAVFAVRQDREESGLQKALSSTYYRLVRSFAIPDYPDGGFDFLLIDRQVVEEVNRISEKNTNLMSLVFWLGFRPVLIPYTRRARSAGRSRWTLPKKIKLFIDTFASFSYFPIRLFSFIGILFAVAAFLYGAFVLITWASIGISVRGWVTTIVLLAFTSGVQMTMLGILGEYLWRTLDETRKRPPFVIDQMIGFEADHHPAGEDTAIKIAGQD
jgi:dolichol-phosphate mannosyltransferase